MGQSSKPLHASLNELAPDAAREALTVCCGSQRWVTAMMARRPFGSTAALFEVARETWWALDRQDHLEAFQHQPRIGESLSGLAKRFPRSASVVAREHAKVAQADPETLQALREANQRYSERFGYTFIVSATGKSAQQILQVLRERLANDPARELEVAAENQSQIIAMRLARLG